MAPISLHALVRTRFFPLIFVAALLPLAAVVIWFYMMSFEAIEEVLGQQTGRRAQTTAAAAARVYTHLLDDTALLTRGREIGGFFTALQEAGPGAARARAGAKLEDFLSWWSGEISPGLYLQAIYLDERGQPVYKHLFHEDAGVGGLETISNAVAFDDMGFSAVDSLDAVPEGTMGLSAVNNGRTQVFRLVRPLRPLRGQRQSPGYVAVDFARSSIVGTQQNDNMNLLIREREKGEILILSTAADTNSVAAAQLPELKLARAADIDVEDKEGDETRVEVFTFAASGEEYLASRVYLEKPFWAVTVFTPMNAYMAPTKKTGDITLLITACFMAFSIFLVAKLTRRVQERSQLLEQANADLQEANQVVHQHNVLLEKELDTAHNMQMQLMPTAHPRIEGFDIAGMCRPATHVGGDFFQYFPLSDGRLVLAMADVTGHGMEAAIPTVLFSGILDNQMEYASSSDELFSRLNRSLYRTLNRRTFVCFTMGELDPARGCLRVTNGGCPYPYHYSARTGMVEEVRLDAFPLGLRPESDYAVVEVELAPGDRLVFCSDGVIETAGGEEEIFGFERTAAVIGQAAAEGLAAVQVIERLLDEVDRFCGAGEQHDDQTIVVLGVEG